MASPGKGSGTGLGAVTTGGGAEPCADLKERLQAALALTEFDEDVLGLVECHLLEGLPHQDLNGPCIPVLRGVCTQQVGLRGQPGRPQPGVSSAWPWHTVWDRDGGPQPAARGAPVQPFGLYLSSPLPPSQHCVCPHQGSLTSCPITTPPDPQAQQHKHQREGWLVFTTQLPSLGFRVNSPPLTTGKHPQC